MIILDPYLGPLWTHFYPFGPFKTCPIWTHLVPFGKVWTSFDLIGPILNYLDLFEKIWCHLEQFGALWTNLDVIGHIESMILHDVFCPERLRDFFPERLLDFCCPEMLPDFFWSREIAG